MVIAVELLRQADPHSLPKLPDVGILKPVGKCIFKKKSNFEVRDPIRDLGQVTMSSKRLAPFKLELSRLKNTLNTFVSVQPDIESVGRLESAIQAYKGVLQEYQGEIREIIMELENDESKGANYKKCQN